MNHTSAISRVSRVGMGASVLFAALAVAVTRHNETIQSVDDYIHSWAMANRGQLSSSIAGWITWGGASALTLPALIIVGAVALRGNRRPRTRLGAGILLAGVAGIGGYLELSINSWIGRARPPKVDWTAAATHAAFPSGHTTAATIFALFCAWTVSARIRSGWPRIALWTSAAVYALAVGWSRIWLGVHWPSDVLGAWLYSVAWAGLSAAAWWKFVGESTGKTSRTISSVDP